MNTAKPFEKKNLMDDAKGKIDEDLEKIEAPIELNDVALPKIGFDSVDGQVLIAPAPSLHTKSKADEYIKRKIKMKVKNSDDKIVEVPTTCFGKIEFRGSSRRAKSKFARISNDTPPKTMYKLLVKYWKLDQPQLLISVTGGAKNFNMSPMVKQNFIAGISKVASTPGAWVITGGTNCGVMKYVGEAMEGLSNPCIGIATWGVISKRNELDPDTCTCNIKEDREEHLSTHSYSYEVGSWLTEKGAYLDSNHTHFLLVDDGTENKFGVEIPVRGELESCIMAGATLCKDGNRAVPSVLVVLEGGPGTLGTVHSAVSGDSPVPVVIVKSSGRAADLIAFALTISAEILIANQEGVHEGLMEAIGELLPELDEQRRRTVYKQLIDCLEYERMFTISQVGTEVDLDDAILTALLNDCNTSRYRQLQLTLLWNRADLARAKIMSTMLNWDDEDDPKELQWLMIMALAMNNVDFVALLMEYGVCISMFLTNELVEFLYGFRSYDKTSPLRYEIRDSDYQSIPTYSENKEIYKMLCSQEELVTANNVMIPRKLIESLIRQLCKPLIRKGNESFIEANESHILSFKTPFRELFFWAILNNMQDMALFFWKKGEEHVAKALIGAHLCNAIIDRRIIQGDIENSLRETECILKDGALQLLDHCYKRDEYKTQTLITSDLEQFNELTVIQLASRSSNIDFVSHYAVQGLLEQVWVGNLKMKRISLIKIFFSSIFVFPVLCKSFFQFRTKEEMSAMRNHDEDLDNEDYEEEESEDTSKSSSREFANRSVYTPEMIAFRI